MARDWMTILLVAALMGADVHAALASPPSPPAVDDVLALVKERVERTEAAGGGHVFDNKRYWTLYLKPTRTPYGDCFSQRLLVRVQGVAGDPFDRPTAGSPFDRLVLRSVFREPDAAGACPLGTPGEWIDADDELAFNQAMASMKTVRLALAAAGGDAARLPYVVKCVYHGAPCRAPMDQLRWVMSVQPGRVSFRNGETYATEFQVGQTYWDLTIKPGEGADLGVIEIKFHQGIFI